MEKGANHNVTTIKISKKVDKINNTFHHTNPNVEVNEEANRYNVVYVKSPYKNALCG